MRWFGLTIYGIAKKAGVSPSTVSRVLNGKSNLSEEIKLKVQKVLDETNYVPSAMARGLPQKRFKLIGVFVQDIRHQHYADIAFSLEQELTKREFGCILCNTGKIKEKQLSYIKMLASRKVDGVVLVGSNYQNNWMKTQINEYLPNISVIVANGYYDADNVCGIISDEMSSAAESVLNFYNNGKKNIAFISEEDTPSNKLKYQGYCNMAAKLNIDYTDEKDAFFSDHNNMNNAPLTGADKTKDTLKRVPTTNAILYTDDDCAISGMHYLLKNGYRIPADIEIISYNNSETSKLCIPGMTSIDNKRGFLGELSVSILIDMLEGKNPPKKTQYSTTIVYRNTSPKSKIGNGIE